MSVDLCVWYKGSTNKETLESIMPVSCQVKHCDGFNKSCLLYQARGEVFRQKAYDLKQELSKNGDKC